MNDATLNFLLDFAEYDQPIQHSYFEQNPAICLDELLAEGYLKPAQAPDEIYAVIDGGSYPVHSMEARGKTVYWCTVEGETVDLEPTVGKFYTLDYTPFAKVLKTHLRAEVTDDRKAPNRAWDLGTPDAALDEVRLVRNAGTDAEVIQIMAKYGENDTVYWFGTEPEPTSTPAQLCRLSSFLTCSNGKICHTAKLPPRLRMAEDYQTSTCANRIVKTGRHTYTYTYNNVSIDPISDLQGAAFLARIIRAGAQGIPLLEVLSGTKISGDEISREDIEAHGMGPERSIHTMTKDDRKLYESLLARLNEQLQEAEENKDDNKIINKLKTQKTIVQGILNSRISFEDGFSKLRHVVSAAIKTALFNRFKKEGLNDLVTHLTPKKTLVIGVYCYYYPQKTTEWDTTRI